MSTYVFNGSSSYLVMSSAVFVFAPFTVAGWYFQTNINNSGTIFVVGSKGVANINFIDCQIGNDALGVAIRIQISGSSGTVKNVTNATKAAIQQKWTHAAYTGSVVNTNSIGLAVYLNGGDKGTDTANFRPNTNFGETRIGAKLNNANFTSGNLAYFSVWNAVLTDAEVYALSRGTPASSIRANNLIFNHYLEGYSSSIDRTRRNFNMTRTNNLTSSNNNAPLSYTNLREVPAMTGIS